MNVTESSNGLTAFVECVDSGEKKEDTSFFANLIEKMKFVARKAYRPIEELYSSIVADNVACNRTGFARPEMKYPKLFYVGCIEDAFDLMVEDVAKILEFSNLIDLSHGCAKFGKGKREVHSLFKRIIGKDGVHLVLFPSTRFAYSYLMLSQFVKKCNIERCIKD